MTPRFSSQGSACSGKGTGWCCQGAWGSLCGWTAPVLSPFLWTTSSRDRLKASVGSTTVSLRVSRGEVWLLLWEGRGDRSPQT